MDKVTRLENFVLQEILNAPVSEDILFFDGKGFILNGNRFDAAETQNFIVSAESLTRNPVWKALLSEMKRIGYKKAVADSTEWEGVRFGKACLYIVDLLEKKAHEMATLKIK